MVTFPAKKSIHISSQSSPTLFLNSIALHTMADNPFTPPQHHPVVVCSQCKIGVRPKETHAHLNNQHKKLTPAIRQQIASVVQQWDRAAECDSYVPPASLPIPIAGIATYPDALICAIQPLDPRRAHHTRSVDVCRYIARTLPTMKKHWRLSHPELLQNGVPATAQPTTQVACQKVFTSGIGSHYVMIEAQPAPPSTDSTPMPTAPDPLSAQFDRLAALGDPTTDRRDIDTAQADEANPWLRRTQWAEYLKGSDPDDLIQCVRRPEHGDPLESERTAAVVWDALEAVTYRSQRVTALTGHTIRIAAIRVQRDQLPHKPLQAYMDADSIQRHCLPWQQILMFFARTQIPHQWKSPPYHLTRRQRLSWEHLWKQAGLSLAHPAPDRGEERSPEERPDSDVASECSDDSDDSTDGEPYATDIGRPLTDLDRACLDFCIELLNQQIHVKDYECALLCALAVQGNGPGGWRTADTFPPILSKVIKIARFMVVHTALLLDPNAASIMQQMQDPRNVSDWQSESPLNDPSFVTSGSHVPAMAPKTRTFAQWVDHMVDLFMVRGSRSPIQWMLDLRSYGLKVHFSSTVPGHVSWMGEDRLLYKDLNFTMNEFRAFIHRRVSDAHEYLFDHLLFAQAEGAAEIPTIPWSQLYDDPVESKDGWNFLQDPRTPWPVDGSNWLLHRTRHTPSIQSRFIDDQQLTTKRIDVYLDHVIRFREKLCVIVYLCGGQPARGRELLSIRHRNTPGGGIRDVFIEDGLVTFVTKYHKGFYVSNDVKVIHRYLPREIGELVVWYLWLVLPFVEKLQAYRAERGQQDHLRYV